jgi:hypothetical protein
VKTRFALLVIGALLAFLIAGSPAQASGKDYKAYLGCGKYAGNSSTCYQGDGFGATFAAKHRHARFKYKICVKPPSGDKWCDNRHTNRGGSSFVSLYGGRFDNDLGTYKATWKVGGKFAGRDRMTLKSEGV